MHNEIHLKNVEKVYGEEGGLTYAVQQVTISFRSDEFTAIVGPSGSGKSTLINLIGTLDEPTKGSIYFNDQDISKLKGSGLADFRFEQIGFVFQQFQLFPTMTALENIMVPIFPRKVSFNKAARAKELLEQVGLLHKSHSLPAQLSGGEQQRIAIARALVNSPKWLIADEPTGNLDSHNSTSIFQLLRDLQKDKGCGVIMVTHDIELSKQTDRLVEVIDGRISFDSKGEKND